MIYLNHFLNGKFQKNIQIVVFKHINRFKIYNILIKQFKLQK